MMTIRRELSDDVAREITSSPGKAVQLLTQFKAGEYWQKNFHNNPQGFAEMTKYVRVLKQLGLDIGKGACEFGYKMPLPGPGAWYRELYIFRRR